MDKATIFFASWPKKATTPPNSIVVAPTRDNDRLWLKQLRTIRYTPAVTRVLECTNDETGVGAAMAAGSQEEKGY